jgi:hypothetical protein
MEGTVLQHIRKMLEEATELLDAHSRKSSNLFLAYFDLKNAGALK